MSQHSPQSSGGGGPSSSPFAGTDPTLYSPDIVRKHGRDNGNQMTMAGAGKLPVQQVTAPLPSAAGHLSGAFVNEMLENERHYISRYFLITKLPDGTMAGSDSEHELNSVQHQMKLYACFSNSVPVYSRGVHVRFDDLREAAEAKLILEQHQFTVKYITGYTFAVAGSKDTSRVNEFEGQVRLPVVIEPLFNSTGWEFTDDNLTEVADSVKLLAAIFGPIRNCFHVKTYDDKMQLVFRVEFHSIDAAHRAVYSLRTSPIWGVGTAKTYRWATVDVAKWLGPRPINSPHRNKPHIDDRGRLVGYRPAPNPCGLPPYSRHPADQYNRVRRERILDGSDVRTTIMLRNIPNKLDWLSLKAVLDAFCFGTYDFMYLRIDFKSGCNVGYAFINFADVNGMIALIDRVEGRGWAAYHSSKAAEISYATIQGREALVQKFRNSSVMQETPFCRPRLFLTHMDAELAGRGRSAGTEQAFPIPDNLSKLQRSMDSARSIGLFPPHGYSAMAEHRNRSSVYDRGTPRDMMQAATNFAHDHIVGPTMHTLTESMRHDVEAWYSFACCEGKFGYISFDSIPLTYVAQYFANQRPDSVAMSTNVGVIGGPATRSTRLGVSDDAIHPGTASNSGSGAGSTIPNSTAAPDLLDVEISEEEATSTYKKMPSIYGSYTLGSYPTNGTGFSFDNGASKESSM